MYNIKGPSKMVAKSARRGISQKVDNCHDNFKHCKSVDSNGNELINVPKPIFHNTSKRNILHNQDQNMRITPQHEEIIKYIQDSWTLVRSDLDENCAKKAKDCDGNCTVLFYEDDPSPRLQDFKPFDLETWWGKRLYHFITNSVNGQVDKT
ncbi:hypothetical protein RI129_008733 [Pyrocoelia pectoralis]|uniref:Uncharacterized protein n=1 Tax=Pyrocoelia pectoralis TaxID=417401 RepID=A0AAN7VBM7_9COLE